MEPKTFVNVASIGEQTNSGDGGDWMSGVSGRHDCFNGDDGRLLEANAVMCTPTVESAGIRRGVLNRWAEPSAMTPLSCISLTEPFFVGDSDLV